jgi:hypothetical protein
MDALLQDIKRDLRNWTVIIDLPPVLEGTMCVLFVAAVGTSTVSEIKESNKHLESAAIVRFVLNNTNGPEY